MRIAITTFFQSQTNYGQLLQAYALQQVLMQLGHYPYIIRYGFHEYLQPVHGEMIEIPTSVPLPPHTLKERFKAFLKERFGKPDISSPIPSGTKEDRHFDDFRKMHIHLSQYVYNCVEDLQKYPPLADCYLTGSDQVWAQLLSNPNNRTFFLDFGFPETRRIAYAPSFAVEKYPEDLNEELARQLKRFQAISVREQSGVEICRNVGYDAKLVLDPTLLLTGWHYKWLSRESSTPLPSRFMFVYHVNITDPDILYWEKFREYNRQGGLRQIAVHANGENEENIEILKDAEYWYPTIQDWIRLMANSRYVLTSSFHGMIFSILLHKPFFVCLRPEGLFAGNGRIATLLSLLGLEDRIVSEGSDIGKILGRGIHWWDIDKKLKRLRKDSVRWLAECIMQN
ncbi:MAG: polysaccharide pyruvyl transferase family protein [Bacteroidaceae bacterium]|nr:polysaccharide pyruvyl transferase family protein [Bacteroidaceae bacterium]